MAFDMNCEGGGIFIHQHQVYFISIITFFITGTKDEPRIIFLATKATLIVALARSGMRLLNDPRGNEQKNEQHYGLKKFHHTFMEHANLSFLLCAVRGA